MKEKDQAVTFLGKDTEFEGTLTFHGAIRIDGHFKGEITADGSLVVGEDAMIEANIHVSYIVVRGEVHGNIIADQRVDIRAPAKVFANIQTPTVMIDEGVIFEGNVFVKDGIIEKVEHLNPLVKSPAPADGVVAQTVAAATQQAGSCCPDTAAGAVPPVP